MRSTNRGFTLIELMIVVVIIAILATVAYPSYMDSVRKTRRGDAQGVLMGAANALERLYTEQNSYATAAVGAGGIPNASPIEGNSKFYDITFAGADTNAGNATTYTLRAKPRADTNQAGDGCLTLTQTGQRRWFKGDDNCADNAQSW